MEKKKFLQILKKQTTHTAEDFLLVKNSYKKALYKTQEVKKMKKLEEKLKHLPGIEAGKGIYQNRFHEFDVFDHTMSVVEHVKKKAQTRH